MESLKFLARQECAIQGHTENGDGNLYHFLTSRSTTDIKVFYVVYTVLIFAFHLILLMS